MRETEQMLKSSAAARAAGITPQQLQYYLMVGLVEPSGRTAGDQRLFDRRTVRRIRAISLANAGGYGLREIREIFIEPPSRRSGSLAGAG